MSREGALWIGGLEPYMDEEFLKLALQLMGEEVISIKVIKNKFTGEPASYGFINFDNDPAALMAMHKLNGKIIPNSQPPSRFKLNHQSNRLMPGEKDFSIWVGDLTPDVDDLALFKFFSARFQTVKSAKVVLDAAGYSKGYGFIRFGNEQEQQTALISMQGIGGLGSKGIKVSIAVPKAKMEAMGGRASVAAAAAAAAASESSIADSLPANALAVMVANASGNPNAGAAVISEAQNAEYQRQWQQYQQQYWTQYAAWSQYQQQYQQQQQEQAQVAAAVAAGATGEESDETVLSLGRDRPRDPTVYGHSIFEGEEVELVEHTWEPDTEADNDFFMTRSEELWESLADSLWVKPMEAAIETEADKPQPAKSKSAAAK